MSRVGVSRTRHLRHRDRFRRSETHLEWRGRRADLAANGGIGDTADAQTFTADNTTEQLTAVGHGYVTGDGPLVLTTDGTLPAELSETQLYWAVRVDDDIVQLASSPRAAADGSVIAFSDDGSGTHSIQRAATAAAITEWNRQGNKPETIEALADIDDL